MTPRLKEQYDKLIVASLQKKFSIKNKYMVPKFTKIILNMGLGADANDKKKVQIIIIISSLSRSPVPTAMVSIQTRSFPPALAASRVSLGVLSSFVISTLLTVAILYLLIR